MAQKGVSTKHMESILEQLQRKREVFLRNVDSSTRRRLYEWQEQGIITLESGVKIKIVDGIGALRVNKKHQRIVTPMVIGALLMSESWLAYLYTLIL